MSPVQLLTLDDVLGLDGGLEVEREGQQEAEQDAAENSVSVRTEWEGKITLTRKPGV